MSQLDKFKRRLIRSVARLRVDEKKPDKEVWEILNKEMGCDCGPLWDRMRALTVKKLSRLLVCADRADMIASLARPSETDMLMFDLVLAHDDDVDVIGRETFKWTSEKSTDSKALEELFDLVQEFSLEETPAAKLAETWEEAVWYYEQKGNRLTSHMLLQRRWYQLKELTRANFYNLWQSYRGNSKLWTEARTQNSLTDLQVAIAERYPYIITKPFPKWDLLIQAGLVVLPNRFKQKAPEKNDSGASGNEQDLVLVEPVVETIDLGADSDSDPEPINSNVLSNSEKDPKRTDDTNTATAIEFDPNITIKTEPPDSDGLSNIKILEATHIPVEQLSNARQDIIKTEDIDPRIALKNDLLRNISKCMESTDELIKQCDPQEDQSENVQNALNDVEHQIENIMAPHSSVETIENELELEPDPQISDGKTGNVIQGKAMNYFREKIVEEMGKYSIYEETTGNKAQEVKRNDDKLYKSNVTEDNNKDSFSPEKEITAEGTGSSEEEDVFEDIIKQTTDDFVNKSKQNKEESSELTLTDLTIVDDGIAFVDDGVDYEDNENMIMEIDADKGNSINSEKQEDAMPSIDLKLLMTPLVITTRLDDMLAFKDKQFECVVDRSTINFAEVESKPKQAVKEPVPINHENKSDADDSNSEESEDDEISEAQRIKPTSYLLQKPKILSYNPIQLCKNPDFNTRLKRLTFGFFSSERNRQFLSACKPATIDLHKSFEDKLVNGTLYLKRSVTTDVEKENSVQKDDQSTRTVSVVPSAMPVQSLIDRSKINFQPPSAVSSIDLTSDDITERNKVIHLPDITQVRRINQKLLTAEVPPIRVQNNVSSCQPPPLVPSETTVVAPRNVEAPPATANRVEITDSVEENTGLVQKPNNSNSASHVLDNAPILSDLLVTHKPPSFPKISTKNAHLLIEDSSPTLQVGMTQKVPETQVLKPPANPNKPPRKPWTRPIRPYLSWQKTKVCKWDDFLITHDTLLKMLAKAKNQTEFTYSSIGNKNSVNICKKVEKGVKSIKKRQRVTQKSKQLETNNTEVIINQKSKLEQTKTLKAIENQKNSKNKNVNNIVSSVRARKETTKTICCWARAWVFKTKGQLLRLPRHMCPFPECNCCCKDELSRPESKNKVDNNDPYNDPIELSDEDNDNNLKSVSKIIESVVQQSLQVPVPKLRVYSTDKPKQNLNRVHTDFTLGSNNAQKNTYLDNIVVESVCEGSEIENNVVVNALKDVVDDECGPVTNVEGEVSVFTNDTVTNNSVNVESSTNRPKRIFVIPEASLSQMNESNHNSKVESSSQEFNTASKTQATQNDVSKPTPSLIPFSAPRNVYAVYAKPSKKPPSVSMSTQTMDVPLLQNLEIEPKVKSMKISDVEHEKKLVIDGTRPLTTPRPILVNEQDQIIYFKASKVTPENPIYLGKNKILLTTVKFPSQLVSPTKENKCKENKVTPKVVPTFPLPEGVEIVLQPNGELACMVKPGVELDHTQISILPSILEAVKQQINTQQPFVVNDVINLSDDENEQTNKNASETSRENIQTEKKLLGDQLLVDIDKNTNKIVNQENCQEQTKQSNLLIQKEHVIGLSNACDVSAKCQTKESETENLSRNQKSKQEETNICQVQVGDTLQSQICNDNLALSDKKRDEDQQDKTQTKNNKSKDDKLNERDVTKSDSQNDENTNTESDSISVEHTSKGTEADNKKTLENNERSVCSRNLLSDLMEMSGISEEDIKMAPDASTPTLPAVINIDPGNLAHEINSDTSVPALTPVTSIAQLKYACEQNGKFFKLDFQTGTLVPISVCIKKKSSPAKLQSETVEFAVKETGSANTVDIPANAKVAIPANPKGLSPTSAETRPPILIRRFQRNKKCPVFSKPITILRHTRPQSLLRNKLQKRTRAFKKQRNETAEKIEAKIDLVDSDAPMEEEYLITSESDDYEMEDYNVPGRRIVNKRLAVNNNVTEISDDSSDDEPLALKSKRMRSNVSVPTQAVTETVKNIDDEHEKNIREFLRFKDNQDQQLDNEDVQTEVPVTVIRMPEPESMDADNMELDTDLPAAAFLEEPMPEPEADDSVESESSPEDSILGM